MFIILARRNGYIPDEDREGVLDNLYDEIVEEIVRAKAEHRPAVICTDRSVDIQIVKVSPDEMTADISPLKEVR